MTVDDLKTVEQLTDNSFDIISLFYYDSEHFKCVLFLVMRKQKDSQTVLRTNRAREKKKLI